MKRIPLFILALLLYHSGKAQNTETNLNSTDQPITTQGISIPQLITTDLNRSTLRFHLNLSDGLSSPNLAVGFEKFISDDKKQFTIGANAGIAHSLSFSSTDNQDFYTLNSIYGGVSTDLKLFNPKDYFIQLGTENRVFKAGSLTEFDFVSSHHSVSLGFGKGRIDYVNDGTVALNIIDKLKDYGILLKDLSDDEKRSLVQLIQQLKNRRKFVNRSYPLSEAEEIQELLLSFEAIDQRVNVIEIIDDVYRIEPMADRTTGSQFSVNATGTYSTRPNTFGLMNTLSMVGNISYSIHRPINLNWQHNFNFGGYIFITDDIFFDPTFEEDKIKRIGVQMTNDLHYLVNTNLRLSLKNTMGFDFKNSYLNLFPEEPIEWAHGFYINSSLQTQFQFNRTTSATFGINLNISQQTTFTGLNLGLTF